MSWLLVAIPGGVFSAAILVYAVIGTFRLARADHAWTRR